MDLTSLPPRAAGERELPSLLFGDNQFFGVNHMSEEKARAQATRFQSTGAIISLLDCAYQEGIRVFMCTTHERIAEICEHVRAHPGEYRDFQFYPCMPYGVKYANAATEHGVLGALRRFLPEHEPLAALMKGGLSLARRDIRGIGELLIDAEMKMFRGLATPVIFLQNLVTDLLLGLGLTEALRIFAEHVRRRYGAEPGYITMNLPRALEALEAAGIENPIVCAAINKLGFRMCGGIAAYEQAIAERRFRPVAMSVMASGAIAPREALQYVCEQPQIRSVVFGASSRSHVRETRQLFEELRAAASLA
jgi:hypothetical protein